MKIIKASLFWTFLFLFWPIAIFNLVKDSLQKQADFQNKIRPAFCVASLVCFFINTFVYLLAIKQLIN